MWGGHGVQRAEGPSPLRKQPEGSRSAQQCDYRQATSQSFSLFLKGGLSLYLLDGVAVGIQGAGIVQMSKCLAQRSVNRCS